MENKKFDLEDRLVKFACMCLDVCDLFPQYQNGTKRRSLSDWRQPGRQNKIASTF
jgi:hypothetical protein